MDSIQPHSKSQLGLFNFIKILAFVLFALIGAVAILYFFRNPFTDSTSIDVSRANVIKEIQSLGRLETASYSIEKIVEAGEDGNGIENFLFGDRLLLIANGKVVAGVDLMTLREEDVNVNGENVLIRLPAPIIISSALDNEKTKVYDRNQGVLYRGNKDLETEARQSAEIAIRQAACEAGILDDARENAIERIRVLFKLAEFKNIEVNIPTGSC